MLLVAVAGGFVVGCGQSDPCSSRPPSSVGSALSDVSVTSGTFPATWRHDSVSGVDYQPAAGPTTVTFKTSALATAPTPASDGCSTGTIPVQLELKTADGALAESFPATYSPDDGLTVARFLVSDIRGTFSIANPDPGLKLDFGIWRNGSGSFGGSLPFVPDPNLPPGTITGTGTGFVALFW